MKKSTISFSCFITGIFIGIFVLTACSSENTPQPPKAARKGAGAKTLRVSGYIAREDSTSGVYSTDGELVAANQVDVAAETAGKVVKLYAKDGQSVSQGFLLAKLDDAELQANLKSAKASLDLAQKKAARIKTLFEKDGATAEELEAAESAVQSAEASRDLILAQLKKTEIRAPFVGVLGVVDISEGAWITAGSKIATLTDKRKLKVDFDLPQRYAYSVKNGDKVELTDSERGESFVAKIAFMDATLSNSSRTRKVRAIVDNANKKLLAGTYVRVRLNFGNGTVAGFPIPSEAVTLDANGAFIFIVKEGKALEVRVKTGLRTPITVNILSGLSAGDTVVVSGLMNVRNGMSLEIKDIVNNMNYGVKE